MSSCVYHSGLITSPVSHNDKDCEYVDIAVGYSQVSYFLGIGGFNKDAFLNEAKRNLYFSYPIKNGQSFENLTLDLKTTLIWPYRKVEAIVIADIVERDTTVKIKYAQNYLDLLYRNNSKTSNFLSLNESIGFLDINGSVNNGKIIKLNKHSVTIFFLDNNGVFRVENKEYNSIFKYSYLKDLEGKVGFSKGDKIKFSLRDSHGQTETFEGEILGLNRNSVLAKSSKGKIVILRYEGLKKI